MSQLLLKVAQSHTFWMKSYALTRSVQGRMNDLGMLCAAHAARGPDGQLTEESKTLLTDLARNLRLVHLLFWADVSSLLVPLSILV